VSPKNIEIERKFLVSSIAGVEFENSQEITQAYLLSSNEKSLRVRIKKDRALLTYKESLSTVSNYEFEYEIPMTDARAMIANLNLEGMVEKVRHTLTVDGKLWEIDEFKGKNSGLILAEIELNSEEESYTKPDFIGKEVTGDKSYLNVNLAKK
jgi:adenylate cyclase